MRRYNFEETLEKSNPDGWASNNIGELAAFCHSLAVEVQRLRGIVENYKSIECHNCGGDSMQLVEIYKCESCDEEISKRRDQ